MDSPLTHIRCTILRDFDYAEDGVRAVRLMAGASNIAIRSAFVPGLASEGYVRPQAYETKVIERAPEFGEPVGVEVYEARPNHILQNATLIRRSELQTIAAEEAPQASPATDIAETPSAPVLSDPEAATGYAEAAPIDIEAIFADDDGLFGDTDAGKADRDPLDHDGDGKPGGSLPSPEPLPPGAPLPDNWRDLHWKQRVKLARDLGAKPIDDEPQNGAWADAYLQAFEDELRRFEAE